MKILFLMDSPEYLRFYDSAIEALAVRGHSVSIAVNISRLNKPVGLEGLQAYADRVSVLGVVPRHEGRWGAIAHDLRATMDFVRFLHPRFAGAHALRERIKRKVLPLAYHWLDLIPRLSAGGVRAVERSLATLERAVPVCPAIVEFLEKQRPDVLLVSPLVVAASEQVDWIKAARTCGIRSAVCIASWDNLTNKGLLRIEPDLVIVWNEAQKREAQEYHYTPPGKIAITGAQLFDRWFEKSVTHDREAFCRRVGLPDSAPFLLFTGSSSFVSESSAEVGFVRRWVTALRASGSPALRSMHVLVRPHPYNVHRWADDPLADLPGVSVFPRKSYSPIEPGNRDDFFDSLFHCAAVVGINTSAMIEAAILGRPVLSLLTPEFADTQPGTIHFHHLLVENGGFVRVASSFDGHVRQLEGVLADPDAVLRETRQFVGTFVRPKGLDRPATAEFVGTVERFAAERAPDPQREPAWVPLLRPLLGAAAAPALLVDWLRKPATLGRPRKRVARWGRVTRKTATTLVREHRWALGAHCYVALVALGLGYFITRSPLQVSENVRNLLSVQRSSLWDLIVSYSTEPGFLRPMLFAFLDVSFELSNGHYFETFKAIHVLQVVVAGMLFVNLLQVRTAAAALAVPFGVAMLYGAHTFSGTVVEGFPINTFLTIVICCLAAANLSRGLPSRWRDVAAALLFVFAALTVETGLLVWVCLVAAWIAGFRGVSRRGIAATSALLVGYVLLRIGPLDVGTPSLAERSSGFGFRVLDPPELIARFGDQPLWFYAYNVASQVLTVLFSEPKAGVWTFVRAVSSGEWIPRDVIPVLSSIGATVLIAWYASTRLADWRRRKLAHADRWLLVAMAMVLANAVISYPYTKDVVVSPAGAFYALAGTFAFGAALNRLGRMTGVPLRRVAATLALAALSMLWAVRLVGVHYALRERAFVNRNDWAFVAFGQPPIEIEPATNPKGAALVWQLREDAVGRRVANPAFMTPAAWQYFEAAW